ncbi:contractile injection system protein, VgrG/Pvc8 family [Paenibacillus algorifonticola]|uniref:contractile injection system protein, VgrG/Pvc8 family n=1 Tax=Paenibacillus algorifonticola TaxID=684063 RepID=UPI000697F882|nr:contractile injection system protein, VgrG/Pvc8 family [Paenibacillus algorifonticola]
MIGYDRLRVEGPCKLKHITDVAMNWKPGEHGTLRISGIVEEELRTNATLEAVWQDKIALYDEEEGTKKPLFKGVVSSVQTVHRNGVYTVEIEAVSGSIYSDLKKRKRSFQDTSQTYGAILTTVLRAYSGGDILLQQGEKEKPSEPVIQYEETDWELTKRLASQFQSVVVCDILEETPKLFIGMPEGKEHKLPDGASYTVSKDLAAFQKAGGEAAGLHDTDFFGYEIQSKTFYRLGDRFKIRGYIELIVSSMTARLEKGQLIYNYRLSREAGIRELPMMNRRLSGLTLQGEILAVKGEQVQVHLAIDDKQDKGTAHWYRYAPETGSAMYSMPQVGTKANLYLADAGGQEAIVTGGVRTNGASAEKTADPNNRYFGTEHGSEMKLSPTGVEFTGGSKEPLFLKLDDAVGIILSSPRKLTLTAKEEISLFTPKRVVIGAQALLVAKKTSAPSGITLEGEYNLMGAQIRTEGKDRTSYASYDDAPVEGEPPPPPPPPEKPPFSWGKLARNVLAGLAVVAVVAVAAAFTVATLGAGAVVVGAVLAGAAIAGTAAVVSQAVSDIARGEVSDMGTYVSTAFRETVIGAISGAVFGPFGPMANLGGRMAFGAVQNGFESVIRQTMEGKGFSIATMAMDMGIGGLTGGIMDSRLTKAIGSKIANAKIVKSLGNAFGDSLNKMTGWVGNAADAVKAKLIRDALDIKDAATTGLKKLQDTFTLNNMNGGLIPVGAGGPKGNYWFNHSPDPQIPSPSQHHKDFFKESEAGQKELAERMKNEANDINVNEDTVNEVYGPYYDEAKKLYESNPDWYPNPDESRIVKGNELKEARAEYEAMVRRGQLEKGHHVQGLAFGGENVDSNIKITGESTISRTKLNELELDFYNQMGYGKKNAKVLKIYENENGIIVFGNNPQHTEVTVFQNKVLKWQRENKKR